jgi:rod shape-determining protein MreC
MQQIFNFIFKTVIESCFCCCYAFRFCLQYKLTLYHRSKIISLHYLSGGVYERINNLSEYLNLKSQNDALAIARLKVFYLLLTLFLSQNWKIKGQATLRYCGF